LLRARGRTRREIDLALVRRGFGAPVRARVVRRLEELGYVDDARWALARATSLLEQRRLAPQAIEGRLLAAGVAERDARAAVARACEDTGFEPVEAARRLLASRRPHPGRLSPKERARAARLLASRGFNDDVAEAVLGEAGVETPDEDG
jgi:regulatory protein